MEGVISVPLGWMRMKDHFKLYCTINIARASLQAVLTSIFLYADRGIEGVFEAGCIATLCTAATCFFFQVRSTGLQFKRSTTFKFLSYSYPIVISGILAFFLNGFDKWILAESTNLSQLAFYAITGKFAVALTIAMQPYAMWWSPIRFCMLNSFNGKALVSKFAIYGLLQIALFSLLIGLAAPVVIFALFSDEFYSCILLVGPLLAVFAVKECAEFLNVGCFASESTAGQLKITLISVIIGIILMKFLAPRFNVFGLVLSLFIAQSIRTILLFIPGQKKVALTIPYLQFSLLFLLTFTIIMITNYLLSQNMQDASLIELCILNIGGWSIAIIAFAFSTLVLFRQYLPLSAALYWSKNKIHNSLLNTGSKAA